MSYYIFILVLVYVVTGSPPPTLEELRGDWQPNLPVTDGPSINNFYGSVGTNTDDILSINSYAIPPWTSGIDSVTTLIDGERVQPSHHQWASFEACRRGLSQSGVNVTSRVRMAFESTAVLMELSLVPTRTQATHNLTLLLVPLVEQLTDFPWVSKYPNDTSKVKQNKQ